MPPKAGSVITVIRSVPTPSVGVPRIVEPTVPRVVRPVPSAPVPRIVEVVVRRPVSPQRTGVTRIDHYHISVRIVIDVGVRACRPDVIIVRVEHRDPAGITPRPDIFVHGFEIHFAVVRAVICVFGFGSFEFRDHGFVFCLAGPCFGGCEFGFGGFTLGDFGTVMDTVQVARRRDLARRTSGEHRDQPGERQNPKCH